MSKFQDCERGIKAKVLQRLRETGRFGPRPLVASEYCIAQTGVRADLVVASRITRQVVGVEIKSASDTLRRLPNQLDAYDRYFDAVIVVAAHRHQAAVRAFSKPGLEIWEVEKSGTLAIVRPCSDRPLSLSLAELLTQRELARYQGLVDRGPEGARDAFFAAFEDRHGTSSRKFWDRAGRRISPQSLTALSRFEDLRADARAIAEAQAQGLATWSALAA